MIFVGIFVVKSIVYQQSSPLTVSSSYVPGSARSWEICTAVPDAGESAVSSSIEPEQEEVRWCILVSIILSLCLSCTISIVTIKYKEVRWLDGARNSLVEITQKSVRYKQLEFLQESKKANGITTIAHEPQPTIAVHSLLRI